MHIGNVGLSHPPGRKRGSAQDEGSSCKPIRCPAVIVSNEPEKKFALSWSPSAPISLLGSK
jgi:hypothetical protein